MVSENRAALDRYNSLFDNQRYKGIGEQIANELGLERDDEKVADLMNCVIDTALQMSGHTRYTNAEIKLAYLCAGYNLSVEAVDQIAQYLQIYQLPRDTTAEDFTLTAKALIGAYKLYDPFKRTIANANGIHGWRGNAAYHLLAAADYLVQAAVCLLTDRSYSYVREKMFLGVRQLTVALSGGLRHSPDPDLFDFSKEVFPTVEKREE